jgi:hypothetical protein
MLKPGDTIKFKPGKVNYEGKFSYDGCVPGRTFSTYSVTALEGPKRGRTLKMRVPYGQNFFDMVVRQTVSPAEAEAVKNMREERIQRQTTSYYSLDNVETGDLVTVTIRTEMGDSTYDFKVYEVDRAKLRIKGYKPDTNPGSRKGWVNVGHPSVSFVMKFKGYFNPLGDDQAKLHARRAAESASKRRTTVARRKALREIFG